MSFSVRAPPPCPGKPDRFDSDSSYARIVGSCLDETYGEPKEFSVFDGFGVIISYSYVLMGEPVSDSECNYTVHALANGHPIERRADVINSGQVRLYRLRVPFPTTTDIQPIKMVQADEEPRGGEVATIVGLYLEKLYFSWETHGVVTMANETLISRKECREFFIREGFEPESGDDTCDNYLWFNYKKPACEWDTSLTLLFVRGKLAGIFPMPDDYGYLDEHNEMKYIRGYLNLAKFRAIINSKNYMTLEQREEDGVVSYKGLAIPEIP
ncbi:hypothetical protein QAD02_017447 [Eretmocerus hayati]|uniref:Uncharacterized protein n=1 Tax=Eretmocerus hayati TaxID=131215 RepID=A0ACC2PDL4_9HYME|nr:hypothetical protein QAD02_017447 [Eretmocerus hayati]